jgi:hypothetical protein
MPNTDKHEQIEAVELIAKETDSLFANLTQYLLKMERGIQLLKETEFQTFNSIIGGEYEEVFLEDEGFAEDAIEAFFAEQNRVFEQLLPKQMRYSFIVQVATVIERQLRLLGQALGAPFSENMKKIKEARQALHRSALFAHLAPAMAPPKDRGWDLFMKLSQVRNCIVHAHGNLNEMSDDHQSKLREFVSETKDWQGLKISEVGELISGEYDYEGRKINFCMWVHKEGQLALRYLMSGVVEALKKANP